MPKAFLKLTRTNMRKLASGGKLTAQGITFERTSGGDGVFTVNIMVDGRRIHRVGRESDGTTITQVTDFIAKIRNDAKHDKLSLPKGRKIALSFREAAAKYLERLRDSGGKDLDAKSWRLRLHLVPFFGDTPLSKISFFNIEQYKHQRQQGTDAAKPGTINREFAALSHLFNMALIFLP